MRKRLYHFSEVSADYSIQFLNFIVALICKLFVKGATLKEQRESMTANIINEYKTLAALHHRSKFVSQSALFAYA